MGKTHRELGLGLAPLRFRNFCFCHETSHCVNRTRSEADMWGRPCSGFIVLKLRAKVSHALPAVKPYIGVRRCRNVTIRPDDTVSTCEENKRARLGRLSHRQCGNAANKDLVVATVITGIRRALEA